MMIRKRDGRLVEFDETKITDAIFEAAKSVAVLTDSWQWS